MSKSVITDSSLSNIAAAIRQKLGVATAYKPSEMPAAIQSIPTPNLEALSVTQNGSYTPTSPKNGFSGVTVNVPNTYAAGDEGKVVSNGALVAQTARSSDITQNGTYDTTLNDEVTVAVPAPTLVSKTITQNGTYDPANDNADGYSGVTVNVSGGGGGATILSGTGAPTAAQGSDGDIYLQYGAYTLVEYLESSGTQYIDSGLKANEINGFDVDFQFHTSLGSNYGVYGTSAPSNEYCINTWNGLYVNLNTGSISMSSFDRHKVEARAASLTIDGVAQTAPNWARRHDYNAFLFAMNYGGAIYKAANLRIYSAAQYNNDVAVRNFVPCVRASDSVAGMYDTVNGVFYANAGTGSFTAGPAVSGGSDNLIFAAYLKVNGAWQDLYGSDVEDVNT